MVGIEVIARCLVQSVATGAGDGVNLQGPLWDIESFYVALGGALFLVGILYRERRRQRNLVRVLMDDVSDGRPNIPAGLLRFLRRQASDAHCVVTSLIGLAAKGQITIRLVGRHVELRQVDNPVGDELTPDEAYVMRCFFGSRDYLDMSDLWYELAVETVTGLGEHYPGFGSDHREGNGAVTTSLVLGYLMVMFLLALTSETVGDALALIVIISPVLVTCFVLGRRVFLHFGALAASRPTVASFLREPSRAKATDLVDFGAMVAEMVVGHRVHAGFMGLTGVCVFGIFVGFYGFWSSLVLFLAFGYWAYEASLLGSRPTVEGAMLLAQVACYVEAFNPSEELDGAGGWADAFALGKMDDAEGVVKLVESEGAPGIPSKVPPWFTSSEGDASVSDLVRVLGGKLPTAINDALSQAHKT